MSSVLAVVQARLGSSRYPRKALASLCGRPLIAHVVERVRQVRGLDTVVLAVPPKDWDTFKGLGLGVSVIAPDVPENDVLTRFVSVAAMFPEHDTIARATGDCPLFNPSEAERVLKLYQSIDGDYAWNVSPGYIDGEDFEVFSRKALLNAHWNAHDPSDREHVSPWIRRNYPVATAMPFSTVVGRKTSVDSEYDLEVVRLLLEGAA